jgi:hypothetical protein
MIDSGCVAQRRMGVLFGRAECSRSGRVHFHTIGQGRLCNSLRVTCAALAVNFATSRVQLGRPQACGSWWQWRADPTSDGTVTSMTARPVCVAWWRESELCTCKYVTCAATWLTLSSAVNLIGN